MKNERLDDLILAYCQPIEPTDPWALGDPDVIADWLRAEGLDCSDTEIEQSIDRLEKAGKIVTDTNFRFGHRKIGLPDLTAIADAAYERAKGRTRAELAARGIGMKWTYRDGWHQQFSDGSTGDCVWIEVTPDDFDAARETVLLK